MATDNTRAARSPTARPRQAVRTDEQIEIRERRDVAAAFANLGMRPTQRRPGFITYMSDWK